MEFSKFRNIEGDKINVIPYSLEVLRKIPSAKIYVGADSQKKRKTIEYAVVVAYRYGYKGCHIIYKRWNVRRKGYGRGNELVEKRLTEEVAVTMEVAVKLQEHHIPIHQIDFDLNGDPKWKSNKFVKMATGWAEALGLTVSIKPEVQVATKAANHIVNR